MSAKSLKLSPKTSPGSSSDKRQAKPKEGDSSKMHKRSRSGCFTCRLRRKKCDESRPVCRACRHLNVECEYKRPQWWQHPDRRRKHKETIKEIIRQTKLNEKPSQKQNVITAPTMPPHPPSQPPFIAPGINTPPSLCHSLPTTDAHSDAWTRTRPGSVDSHFSPQFDIETPHEFFNSTPMMAPPAWTPVHPDYPYFPPYEVDIKTERQMYVNEIPTHKDSVVSTFTAFPQPTPSTGSLPSTATMDNWVNHEDLFNSHDEYVREEPLDFNFFDYPHGPFSPQHQAVISVEECDKYLLDHFLGGVARLVFPVLEVNQHGSTSSDVILPALESNKCYLHTCLSTAALHLKATGQLEGEQIDNDILRHRYATISELCSSFEQENESRQNLEATLGLIMFQCAVGSPDDGLPDIPWHQHFVAAKALIEKLDVFNDAANAGQHQPRVSFNTALASWIDILGATMSGRVPAFASSYREKIEAGMTSGLAELMGCEDKVMYLISEISALDSLKQEGLDSLQLCSHIAALGEQLSLTEPRPDELSHVYSSTGAIRPKQLSKNITALFRYAARIHLCSLVPEFDRTQPSIVGLVNSLTDVWSLIPAGTDGFDRCLVWPLLIAGSFATEASSFRRMFEERCAYLGKSAPLGSFGRLREVLQEVWNINDATSAGAAREKQSVHWRDVMRQKGSDFLLI